jgi:hypothetical protein
MAAFCHHCSIIIFDGDLGDFERPKEDNEDEALWSLDMCEHCGFIYTDSRGVARLCPLGTPFKLEMEPEAISVWEANPPT